MAKKPDGTKKNTQKTKPATAPKVIKPKGQVPDFTRKATIAPTTAAAHTEIFSLEEFFGVTLFDGDIVDIGGALFTLGAPGKFTLADGKSVLTVNGSPDVFVTFRQLQDPEFVTPLEHQHGTRQTAMWHHIRTTMGDQVEELAHMSIGYVANTENTTQAAKPALPEVIWLGENKPLWDEANPSITEAFDSHTFDGSVIAFRVGTSFEHGCTLGAIMNGEWFDLYVGHVGRKCTLLKNKVTRSSHLLMKWGKIGEELPESVKCIPGMQALFNFMLKLEHTEKDAILNGMQSAISRRATMLAAKTRQNPVKLVAVTNTPAKGAAAQAAVETRFEEVVSEKQEPTAHFDLVDLLKALGDAGADPATKLIAMNWWNQLPVDVDHDTLNAMWDSGCRAVDFAAYFVSLSQSQAKQA